MQGNQKNQDELNLNNYRFFDSSHARSAPLCNQRKGI